MLSVENLCKKINVNRTVLFYGAGSSVPAGGPTASQLCGELETVLAKKERISSDLMELCSILENRIGRKPIVEYIRERLTPLKPTGAHKILSTFDWNCIYTTNYDFVIENSYAEVGREIVPIRSNFDYGKSESVPGTILFKIHGCLKEDIVDGFRGRMVLTETDYDEYESYREFIFKRLELDVSTKDIVFIGYSLNDAHIKNMIKRIAKIKSRQAVGGNIYCFFYEQNSDKAQQLEKYGVTVVFGALDEFASALLSISPVDVESPPSELISILPRNLLVSTFEIDQQLALPSNTSRMFDGSPAAYSDIRDGYTFERSIEKEIVDTILNDNLCVSIVGVAGSGKTTLARRMCYHYYETGFYSWEHRAEFSLVASHWLGVEKKLREQSKKGVLLIDNCSDFLRQVNLLIDGLSLLEESSLKIILTAESSQWIPRKKSSNIYKHGGERKLSELNKDEVSYLVNLLHSKDKIRSLAAPDFLMSPRQKQVETIWRRCSADMFVAMKYIFSSDSMDIIILSEYNKLGSELQDIYRLVAVLEASGTRVHRQLVLRLTDIDYSILNAQLKILEGLVDEYPIEPADGLYGWKTRHEVIAQVITRFKFSDENEFYLLLKDVVEKINPFYQIERRTLNNICTSDFGVKRISDATKRIDLYTAMTEVAPGERVPWHRLIREYSALNDYSMMEQVIRSAENNVGTDSPIHRYKIILLLCKIREVRTLSVVDKLAYLGECERLAHEGVLRFPGDKYTYKIFEKIGRASYELTGSAKKLNDAVVKLKEAETKILDPQIGEWINALERSIVNL